MDLTLKFLVHVNLFCLSLSPSPTLSSFLSACSKIESNQSIQVSWADQWRGKKLTFHLNVSVCVGGGGD